jgi:putative transposase
VYHVLNRGVGRLTIFQDEGDYRAFEKALGQAVERTGMRLLGYCLMPNHFHLLLWPRRDGELSEFMRLLTVTHAQRWHAHHQSAGTGPVYQGRYRSFPVQSDEPFLAVARYVEANALRAGLVERAEAWPWCSLWRRRAGLGDGAAGGDGEPVRLSKWPVDQPRQWLRTVNAAQSQTELEALRRGVQRGQPFGRERWVQRITRQLGLESAFRPRGRPKKVSQ